MPEKKADVRRYGRPVQPAGDERKRHARIYDDSQAGTINDMPMDREAL